MTDDILAVARTQVLERGVGLDEAQTLEVLRLSDERVPDALDLAHEARMRWCGPEIEVEGIVSVKTGVRTARNASLHRPFGPYRLLPPGLDRGNVCSFSGENATQGCRVTPFVWSTRGAVCALRNATVPRHRIALLHHGVGHTPLGSNQPTGI